MRTHAEWKVEAPTSSAVGPSIAESRSRSSPAALLVKVIARMFQGMTVWLRMSVKARSESQLSPSAYSSRKATSSAVTCSGIQVL